MLKKLFSYDFNAIGKKMWIFTVILLCTTVAGCGAMAALTYIPWDSYDVATGGIMAGLVMLVVISYLAIVAYGVIALVVIISRFYSNLFTDEGYLTFTLPVKTGTIYNAKLLAGSVWVLITAVTEIICTCMLMMFTVTFEYIPEVLSGMGEGIKYLFEVVPAGHMAAFMIEVILICVLALAYQIVLLYISITIAAIIVKKARFIVGTVSYFLINSVVGTVSAILTIIVMIMMSTSMALGMVSASIDSVVRAACWEFHAQFIVNIFVFGGAVLAGYFINKHLLKNKLNLP